MGKSIKKNYIYNLLYQITTMVAPLITTPYISRVLGADGIGRYSFVNSIVAYFSLFAVMGITTYGQREISYNQNDINKRTIVFWNAKSLEVISSLLCFVAFVILGLFQSDTLLYLVLSLNILAVTVDINWLFQGMEEFRIIAFRTIIVKILGIIGIFIFVRTREDLVIYALIMSSLLFLSNLSLWIPARKLINKPVLYKLKPLTNIRDIIALFLPCIAMEVYTVLDKIMIGIVCTGDFENGYYEQATKLSKMILAIVTALGSVMIPRIGHHFENGNNDKIDYYINKAYKFVWFLATPLCLGLMATANNFVPWFFGAGYDLVVPLIMILAFLILIIGINNVTGMQYLIPTRKQNMFTKSVVIGAVCNFGLNLILIPKFGALGAAMASVLAELIVTCVQFFMVKKQIEIKKVVSLGIKNIIAALIMFLIVWITEGYLLSSILNTILLVGLGCIVYVVVLFGLKDSFINEVLQSFIRRIRRR